MTTTTRILVVFGTLVVLVHRSCWGLSVPSSHLSMKQLLVGRFQVSHVHTHQAVSSSADASEHLTTVEESSSSPQEEYFTVILPHYDELMKLSRGEFVASDTFTTTTTAAALDGSPPHQEHTFRVLLYPRGGGDLSAAAARIPNNENNDNESKSGFGMSYKILPFGKKNQPERVGLYLQYVGSTTTTTTADDDNDKNAINNMMVDATFSLRAKGNQQVGPRFDVEWSGGMRFVDHGQGTLSQGTASDFGAHIMQTPLLQEFMGDSNNNNNNDGLQVQVRLLIHDTKSQHDEARTEGGGLLDFRDIRHDCERARVGQIVVPVLTGLKERPRLMEMGAYPGVEYRIMRIFSSQGDETFISEPGAEYELKPIYPLVDQLERPWPVRVKEQDIPKLLTSRTYNVVSALGSLATAVSGLLTAFLISQAISLYVIPTKSMDPTLQVGDVLVVEKVTPRLFPARSIQNNDIVLFHPPSELQRIVSSNGGRVADRDLFVKRVAAAGPGDIVSVRSTNDIVVNGVEQDSSFRKLCGEEGKTLIDKYVKPSEVTLKNNQIFALGDCSSVSIDSRVWGALDKDLVVGKPLYRIWPLARLGGISAGVTSTTKDVVPDPLAQLTTESNK